MPEKQEENMKSIFAVLGLALLMGCANNSDNNDCQRCGKGLTEARQPAVQEVVSAEGDVTPSN